jgi:hypothetical protein
MKRRTLLSTGTAIGLTFLAGCSSNGPTGEPGETGTETRTPTTDEGSGGTSAGEGGLSAVIEPSATEIAWGEEYSVTVTLVAESEYETDWTHTEINWRAKDSSGGITGTSYSMWDLPTGQPDSHTFKFSPPTMGEITFVLKDLLVGDTLTEWELTVEPPVAALGEAIPFYDGLEVTMDARLTETIEAHIYDDEDADLGIYSIRPEDGKQWALAMVTATNTSTSEIYPPEDRDIAVLANGNQLEQLRGLLFAHQNDFRAVEGNPDDAWVVRLDDEADYYDPPTEILPTATTEGWLPYLAKVDASKDDIAVILTRETSSSSSGRVTARWG